MGRGKLFAAIKSQETISQQMKDIKIDKEPLMLCRLPGQMEKNIEEQSVVSFGVIPDDEPEDPVPELQAGRSGK